MEENDCLESIMSVLASVLTMKAKENAAATLYSLSWVHGYKKLIANADGCMSRCSLMVNSGGVSALVGALADEAVTEKAAGVLGVVAKQSLGAESIRREVSAVMRCGTSRGNEKAIGTLLQLCKVGEAVGAEKVVRAPALAGLTQKLLVTGTDQTKRKAILHSRVLEGVRPKHSAETVWYMEGSYRTNVSESVL